jgi:hypothetical protein
VKNHGIRGRLKLKGNSESGGRTTGESGDGEFAGRGGRLVGVRISDQKAAIYALGGAQLAGEGPCVVSDTADRRRHVR